MKRFVRNREILKALREREKLTVEEAVRTF